MTDRLRFTPSQRLRNRAGFDAAFAARRSRGDGTLVVYLLEREPEADGSLPPSRLGLVVGRKYGHSPRRSRIKRLIREAFRLLQHELPVGLDVVVLPRGDAADSLTLEAVMASLRKLVRRPLPDPRPPRAPRRKR